MTADEDDKLALCLDVTPMLPVASPERVDAPLLTHNSLYVLLDCDFRRVERALTWRRRQRSDVAWARCVSGRTRK